MIQTQIQAQKSCSLQHMIQMDLRFQLQLHKIHCLLLFQHLVYTDHRFDMGLACTDHEFRIFVQNIRLDIDTKILHFPELYIDHFDKDLGNMGLLYYKQTNRIRFIIDLSTLNKDLD